MKKMAKWGFGFAPQKKETLEKRKSDIKLLLYIMKEKPITFHNEIIEAISNIKGLFNRIIRQDQWDWFTVYMYFDYPSIGFCCHTANNLANLRKALLENNIDEREYIIDILSKYGLIRYLNNYLHFSPNAPLDCEYIYTCFLAGKKKIC